jgi:hypothetical protein
MSNDNSRDEVSAMAEVTRRPLPVPTEHDEATTLRAEVERLRGEAERERAAVVAWLRTKSDEWSSGILDDVSGFIESGWHRREGGE